jgi:hypothetical protein
VALDLADQQIEVVAGREGHHPEAIGEVLHDLERLRADRTGGAEHGEGFHGWIGERRGQSPTASSR